MSARPKTPTHADEKHAVLYGHPIPENSFAVRDLQHKLPGVGLFDLRRTETGAHACTFCGACQKACPVDCIDVRLDRSRTHGKGKERHFAGPSPSTSAAASPATTVWRPASSTPSSPPSSSTEHRRRVQELANKPPQLSSGHGLCSGCGAGLVVNQVLGQVKNHYVVSGATGCLEVCTTRYPYTAWKGSYIHTNFENAAATLSGVETAFRALYKKRQARGQGQVHRLRRRRRHLRHRPPGPLRRHGARPPDAVRVLRQRRLHEHRVPALQRDAAGRLDHHQPGRQRRSRASSATARTSPRSWWRTGCPTWRSPRRTTRRT